MDGWIDREIDGSHSKRLYNSPAIAPCTSSNPQRSTRLPSLLCPPSTDLSRSALAFSSKCSLVNKCSPRLTLSTRSVILLSISARASLSLSPCVCVRVCVRARACVHVCIHTYIHTYIHAYIHIHTHEHLVEHEARHHLDLRSETIVGAPPTVTWPWHVTAIVEESGI